ATPRREVDTSLVAERSRSRDALDAATRRFSSLAAVPSIRIRLLPRRCSVVQSRSEGCLKPLRRLRALWI
ncbi:MAG: hypothetical protein KDB31_02280, partial [Microthrixaceae bacterium]|nr:hypothetical protein [Microthrixaceae bacterium]